MIRTALWQPSKTHSYDFVGWQMTSAKRSADNIPLYIQTKMHIDTCTNRSLMFEVSMWAAIVTSALWHEELV